VWFLDVLASPLTVWPRSAAFYGSFIDCLVSIPLGMLLVLVQVVVSRNDLYSSLFECVSTSFLSMWLLRSLP
jgi:uncharacterized membrane protein YjjP (DUF1212 family)